MILRNVILLTIVLVRKSVTSLLALLLLNLLPPPPSVSVLSSPLYLAPSMKVTLYRWPSTRAQLPTWSANRLLGFSASPSHLHPRWHVRPMVSPPWMSLERYTVPSPGGTSPSNSMHWLSVNWTSTSSLATHSCFATTLRFALPTVKLSSVDQMLFTMAWPPATSLNLLQGVPRPSYCAVQSAPLSSPVNIFSSTLQLSLTLMPYGPLSPASTVLPTFTWSLHLLGLDRRTFHLLTMLFASPTPLTPQSY